MQVAPHPSAAMQRLGVGSELPGILKDMGADPAALFSEVGVDLGAVSPDLRLEFPRLLHLLYRAAEVTCCQHIGLLCGMRFEMQHHGMIGALMQTAPTLWQAMEDFVMLQPGHSSGAIVYLHRNGPDHVVGYGIYTQTHPGAVVLYDVAIGVGVRLVRHLLGNGAGPLEVHLSHSAPSNAPLYSRLLRAPVRFDQPRTCMMLDAATMTTRLPGANSHRRREMLNLIASMSSRSTFGLSDRVRNEIRRALLHGAPRMPDIADRLGINERTLRRRLLDEETDFTTLSDEVRLAVANELLALTKLPIGDIASAIGFASPSVFAETFRRWSGQTPTSVRAAAVEPHTPMPDAGIRMPRPDPR